jgi:hypothetical protein
MDFTFWGAERDVYYVLRPLDEDWQGYGRNLRFELPLSPKA